MFLEKVYPTEINIYETYNAGGTRKVEAKTDSGTWVTIYEAPKVEVIKASRIFKPPFIVSQPAYLLFVISFNHIYQLNNSSNVSLKSDYPVLYNKQ